jgi:hypothetical protein
MKLCSSVDKTAHFISATEADSIIQLLDIRHMYL